MFEQWQNGHWAGVFTKELNIYYEVGLCHLQGLFQPCNFVICISAEAHDIMDKI